MLEHEWQPVDGFALESAAMKAIKAKNNIYVIAGPGAGKTELLAQKASYLLETGICPFPQKILAISFKRDAAKNLGDRVRKRCGKELSSRFVSLTYDAFAKGLLDRFYRALPEDYKPLPDYDIVTNRKVIIDVYKQVDTQILNTTKDDELENWITETKLPINSSNFKDQIVNKVWQILLKGGKSQSSILTFKMIARLAEYLIRVNPILRKCLTLTYSHVFLDEYQDTTTLQYDLLKTCFFNFDVIITAVGDQRQRIMIWAGADKEAFTNFEQDFIAKRLTLLMNHRSAPRLVKIQQILAKRIAGEESEFITTSKWLGNEGICEIWYCDDYSHEGTVVAKNISNWLKSENIKSDDICILVRQKSDKYSIELIGCLNRLGIEARDESKLQDFLTEDIVRLVLSYIYILFSEKGSNEYLEIINALKKLRGVYQKDEDDVDDIKRVETDFQNSLQLFRGCFEKIQSKEDMITAIQNVVNFFGICEILAHYQQYRNQKYFEKTLQSLNDELWSCFEAKQNWADAVEALKGKNVVPIMTIHKSKGLEYDTVIFIGLEDSAFWNFRNRREEEICNFFVALSRAKRRVIFTYCDKRNTGRYGQNVSQSRNSIQDLYQILKSSGLVNEKDLRF